MLWFVHIMSILGAQPQRRLRGYGVLQLSTKSWVRFPVPVASFRWSLAHVAPVLLWCVKPHV